MKGKWFLTFSVIGILAVTGIFLGLYFTLKAPADTGITITDDLDRAVSINGVPQRIVSLSPGATEILFVLGQESKVVGVTNQCDYPEEARIKDKVGDYWSPSIERVVVLSPDLVLVEAYRPGLITQLEETGLVVVAFQPENIDSILNDIALIGQVVGVEKEAKALVSSMRQRIQAVVDKVVDTSKPGVFYEGDCSHAIWTAGSGTFQDELIAMAGGRNAGAISSGYYEISNEVFLGIDDDIDIIMWGDMVRVPFADVADKLPWSELTAVREGKVYVVDSDIINRAGPRIVDCLEEFARIIHPELF